MAAVGFLSLAGCSHSAIFATVHIDDSFTVAEKRIIRDGLEEWTEQTNGTAQFEKVEYISHLEVMFQSQFYQHATEKHLYIIKVTDRKQYCPSGIYDHLVDYNVGQTSRVGMNEVECLLSDWAYRRGLLLSLVEHETGHALGLKHEPDGSFSVMTRYIDDNANPGEITDIDVAQFCKIYNCK